MTNDKLVHRTPFFYGWVIMLVGSVGLIMTSPAQTYAISIFIEHFIDELELSRSTVSTLYSVGSLVAGFSLAFIGRQIDRYGARLVMVIIAFISGLACIYMGFVRNATMLFFGFLVLRIVSHGGLTLVSQNVINQWWLRRRGAVMGISGVLMSILGLAGFPNLINWLMPTYGWRGTFMIEGLMYLILLVPIVWLFLRNYPEDYGLQPDGQERTQDIASEAKSSLEEENWTLSEALQTPAFWVVGLGIGSMALATTGLFFHMVSIFEDNGLAATVTARAFVPIAATTAIMTLCSGILIDFLPARLLLTIALMAQALSLVMAPFLYNVTLAFSYGIVLGITFGLTRTVIGVVWAMYFGRQNLGTISGAGSTIMGIGAALGPLPFGYGRDLFGNYTAALMLTALLPFVLGLANLMVSKPKRQVA